MEIKARVFSYSTGLPRLLDVLFLCIDSPQPIEQYCTIHSYCFYTFPQCFLYNSIKTHKLCILCILQICACHKAPSSFVIFLFYDQVCLNDLHRNACMAKDVVCVVVDEAHRFKGPPSLLNYSYPTPPFYSHMPFSVYY